MSLKTKDRFVDMVYKVSIIVFAGLSIALAVDYYHLFNLFSEIVVNTHDIPAISGMY